MLSVTIIAKNEEANIRQCLESVKWADEIIVLDSGSTDNTVAIAKEYTDRVYITDWQGYAVQKQRALDRVTGDWVLNIDADESISEPLKESIQKAITNPAADGYRIPILLYFYGKERPRSSCTTKHLRLYRPKDACYSTALVHEEVLLPPTAKVFPLNHPIHHHSFQDLSHALYKMNLYTSYTATIRRKEHRSTSMTKSLFSAGWMFFRYYIIQGGCLEGRDGLLLAILKAQSGFYRHIKMIYPDKDPHA
jgi:glycosyltransferase involved in cell wall biosynthesis